MANKSRAVIGQSVLLLTRTIILINMIKSTAGILKTQTSPADNRTRKKRNISAQENMPISFLKSF